MDRVIVPLAVASLITGLVTALGTWRGSFRRSWVLYSLLLTVVTIAYWLAVGHTPTGATGGLVVLLVINALERVKPSRMTPSEWRKLQWSRASAGSD